MRLPEYSWAQGLLVAVHSLMVAYENDTNCPSMTLERAAEKLDSLRRVHKLNKCPSGVVLLIKLRLVAFDGCPGAHCGLRLEAICYWRALPKKYKH